MLGPPATVEMVPVALMVQPAPVNYAHMVALSQAAQGQVSPEFRAKFQLLQKMETHCFNLAIAVSVMFFPLGLITLGGVLPRVKGPSVVGVNFGLFILSLGGFIPLAVFGSLETCSNGWCYTPSFLWGFTALFIPTIAMSVCFLSIFHLEKQNKQNLHCLLVHSLRE